MTKQNNLFLATLDALHKSGVFEDIKYFALWISPLLIAILPDTLNMSILNLNWNF
jgi:hypothetical protein